MSVQNSANQANFPFILAGLSLVRDGLTLLQDAGRVAALAVYTVMARVAVTVPTTGTADAGNTGNGTVTGVALIAGTLPRAGTWVLECTAAVLNGGTFKLTDPGGNIIRNNLVLTAGAGVATTFYIPEVGLKFIITDGATDFIVGDKFTIAATASGKWVPFNPDAVNGGQIPRGILLVDNVTAAALVAGDVTGQTILTGGACTVDSQQIIFDDGVSTLDTVLAGGKTVRDYLAEIGIFSEDTIDIDGYEN